MGQVANVTENVNFTFAKVYTNITKVQRWFMKFKVGNFSLENESGEKSENITDNNILTDIVGNNSPEKSIISWSINLM